MPGKILNDTRVCGEERKNDDGTNVCIIDNPHFGRAHWGPNEHGTYMQWGKATKEVTYEGTTRRWASDADWVRNDPSSRSSR